jgi:hypothetical protein
LPIINTMNKKAGKYFLYLIILLFLLVIIFFKFFSMPKTSDIDWLEANYQFIVKSSLETRNFSNLPYEEEGESFREVSSIYKKLAAKNITYFSRINVRVRADGTNSIIVKTWTNYFIYKNNRPELPRIGLPIVKRYKGWVVINNRRD